MPSWTLTPTQNAVILEVTKILLSNLIIYLLLTFWWFLGDYNSKVWKDTYITEQVLRIMPQQRSSGYKRGISITSRFVALGSVMFTSFFVTIMTKTTTSSTVVQDGLPIYLTLTDTYNETTPPFNLQSLEASDMNLALAMCRLRHTCSTQDSSGVAEQTVFTPVGYDVSFVPATQGLFFNSSIDADNVGPYRAGILAGFNWLLADINVEDSVICVDGASLVPNSTVMPDSNTVIMEYNARTVPSAAGTGDLGCNILNSYVVFDFNNEVPNIQNNVERVWPSSTVLSSGISLKREVATVSSEIIPITSIDGRALRLDIVTTQQSYVTFSKAADLPYAGTSKYMSKECNDLLKTMFKSDMTVLSEPTSKVFLRRQQDGSVVMDACTIVPKGHADRFSWVHVIVNTSWTTTGYGNQYKLSQKDAGLPGIGGKTDMVSEGVFPVSNLMFFDYSMVSQPTGDLDSTSLLRLDQRIDKYLQSLQKLQYNNDTIWGVRMGSFEMAANQYSMVGATEIGLPYVYIVAILGSLGLIATLLRKVVLDKYYSESFPINIARTVVHQEDDGSSDNSTNKAEYGLVKQHTSSENTILMQLNNRILRTERDPCISFEPSQSQSLLEPKRWK